MILTANMINEINATCPGTPEIIVHNVRLPNPEGKRFDQIDLSKVECPKCGLVGKMQAMPM